MRTLRSWLSGAWVLALTLSWCLPLSGCGESSEKGSVDLTEAQKAERAAQQKETADAFKDFKKANKKKR